MKQIVVFMLCLCSFFSCKYDYLPEVEPIEQFEFLCISHAYIQNSNYLDIDTLVEQIDYGKYDMLLLGGDLLEHTTQYPDTFEWLNSIFHFDSQNTIWALGNHDYDNAQTVRDLIGGPLYYARYFNGVTFLVLDTQDSLSNLIGDQLQLIRNVTDTLVKSSHLVILMHKLIWMVDGGTLEVQTDSICNGGLGNCDYCTNPNNFYADVYPKLCSLENRGVQVFCIGGDIGKFVQKYEYTSAEGIQFLGTGMCSGCALNYGLRFTWEPAKQTLNYDYVPLTELAQ